MDANEKNKELETLMWAKLIKFVSELKEQERDDWDCKNKYKLSCFK
jgi:hypothetical protein